MFRFVGACQLGLVVVELSFILDKVYEVFHNYLMYVIHEFLDISKGYFEFL